MRILITAGNTYAPIDRVRVVTNVFSGRTGTNIAKTAAARGHSVTLLTSHPDIIDDDGGSAAGRLVVVPYQTFDDLAGLLQSYTKADPAPHVIIHCAAVSDYLVAGAYSPTAGTNFNARTKEWECRGGPPAMAEQKGGKLKSSEPEMWLRLVRAPKLVDRFRPQWGFRGLLVKFKLEVGIPDQELLNIAEVSRVHSGADLMVANTLDGAGHWAFVGPIDGRYERLPRRELDERLILQIEEMRRSARGTWHDG